MDGAGYVVALEELPRAEIDHAQTGRAQLAL